MVAPATVSAVISIHALRVEGDVRGGRTRQGGLISIHALRVEGDILLPSNPSSLYDFNPRPPCGGRPTKSIWAPSVSEFQSTPSVWRATRPRKRLETQPRFQSTPSVWRATARPIMFMPHRIISIHALRVEGDIPVASQWDANTISIHALRVEGDGIVAHALDEPPISIHALRVEGDP